MKLLFLIALGFLVAPLPVSAYDAVYYFKPYTPGPGETEITHATTTISNGKISMVQKGEVKKGTLTLKRQRTFERRIIGTGANRKLEYKVIRDMTSQSRMIEGHKEEWTTRGPLTGQVINGVRDEMRRWRLYLKGKTSNSQQAVDLVELESYENRQWFQKGATKVGDHWFIEPSFIRNFIERDMGPAIIEAVMTFKSVKIIDGEKTAVLTFTIKSQAQKKEVAPRRTSSAVANLEGVIHISLATMLDKKLKMTGNVITTVRQSGSSSVITTPVFYLVTKSVR